MKILVISLLALTVLIVLYLMRNFFLFLLGLILLIGGSAGALVGILMIFVNSQYIYGIGLAILASFVGFFGWELVAKSSEIKPPDHASESEGSSFQHHLYVNHNFYDRHHGSSFGSGF